MNLTELANKYGSDKGNLHFEKHYYTEVYEDILGPLQHLPISFLEIGICDPRFPSASVRMWCEYFTHKDFKYTGFDIVDCKKFEEIDPRITIIQGDQSIPKSHPTGNFDVILDDGSHFHYHQISSFNTMFTRLNKGGIYIIEDLHWQDGAKTVKLFENYAGAKLYKNNKLLIIK